MMGKERMFDSRGSLASALASDVANALAGAISRNGKAVLAVSGGRTPQLFLDTLSDIDIKWNRVTVTLVDERMVDESDERSNARFVREHLMKNRAAKAVFVPLYKCEEAKDVDSFDVAVLGMGLDGHTASYFPGAEKLAAAIDEKATERIVALTAPGAPEPRLTFTLPDILNADLVCLHLEGRGKLDAFRKAQGEGPVEDMPIRAVLRARKPITLYWCP
jgi:6-phosphogluconolactonase